MALGSTGCCGEHVNSEKATFTGVLTLAFPLLLVLCAATIVTLPLRLFRKGRRLHNGLGQLLMANTHLIHSCRMVPRARCAVSGKLYTLSPAVSGLTYRSFNMVLLIVIWAALLTTIIAAATGLTGRS